ncbi:uncharacterized protein METZ01_LOCUS391521 [marine metagenome]|uniref:Uncharacterized protein n=1 Tax=marine metagenome TaxID=408172 RepID=A0A382UWY6_9ZZZZ
MKLVMQWARRFAERTRPVLFQSLRERSSSVYRRFSRRGAGAAERARLEIA